MAHVGMTEAAYCGQRVKLYREQRGLSLRQLGKLAGFSHQQIDKVERGDMNVGIQTLARIAQALGVPLPDLIVGDFAETLALVTWAQSDAADVLEDTAQRLQHLVNNLRTYRWPILA